MIFSIYQSCKQVMALLLFAGLSADISSEISPGRNKTRPERVTEIESSYRVQFDCNLSVKTHHISVLSKEYENKMSNLPIPFNPPTPNFNFNLTQFICLNLEIYYKNTLGLACSLRGY